MIAWLLRIVLTVLVRLIPFIVGAKNWKYFEREEKAFIVLLGYDVIGIIVGAFLAYYYHNNIIVSNVYMIAEVFLLSIFFKRYLSDKLARQILSWYPYLFAGVSIITSIWVSGIHNNNPTENAASGVFIIALSAMALGKIVGGGEKLVKNGHFWILFGLLSYYLLNFGYLSTSYWLIAWKSSLTMGFFWVLHYSFYVVNIIFAFGLWFIAKERKGVLMVKESNVE